MMKKVIYLILIGLMIIGCSSQEDETIDNPPVHELVVEDNNNEKHPDIKVDQEVKDDKKEDSKIEDKKEEVPTKKGQKKDENPSIKPKETSSISLETSDNETVKDEPQKEEPKKEELHQHMFVVNGDWFQTEAQAVDKFTEEVYSWEEKLEKEEITYDEYLKKCPCGYEVYRCTCGLQGLNNLYR